MVVPYAHVISVSGGGKMKVRLSGETLTFLPEQTDIPDKNPLAPLTNFRSSNARFL